MHDSRCPVWQRPPPPAAGIEFITENAPTPPLTYLICTSIILAFFVQVHTAANSSPCTREQHTRLPRRRIMPNAELRRRRGAIAHTCNAAHTGIRHDVGASSSLHTASELLRRIHTYMCTSFVTTCSSLKGRPLCACNLTRSRARPSHTPTVRIPCPPGQSWMTIATAGGATSDGRHA